MGDIWGKKPHPDSPDGGTGPGFSRPPGPALKQFVWPPEPHPDAPAARYGGGSPASGRLPPSLTAQIGLFATPEQIEDFRRNPFALRNTRLLMRALTLYLQQDTTPPEERSKVILRNLSLAAGYAAGLGQNTTKALAGQDVSSDKVWDEMPGNSLVAAGWTLKAYQVYRETAMASKGFRAWLESSDVDRAFSEAGTPDSSGAYQGPQHLARGNFGERAAAEALAADGHTILYYKPDIMGTNQGGIDIVSIRNGMVYFIDNKAISRSGNIAEVSALTDNFVQNRAAVIRQFTAYVNDATRPAAERALFRRAIDLINDGKTVRAATNANVARDTRILSGVSQKLRTLRIQFIDVMR
jgi:Holliday junction resolvase-like predicted endonuclease